MRSRAPFVLASVLCVLGAACGGGTASGAAATSPVHTSTSPPPPPSPSPLVVPKDCRPDGSAPEISTVNMTWVGANGRPLAPGEACIAVPTGPFTVTVHNDVHGQGIGAPNHNFAVYTDTTASDELFRGELVYPGQSMTYHVPKMPAGVYFFQCDIHPAAMNGVLVVT